ncbi:branched-chain amino acid ABC transporter permease [Alloalcanivorax sp. C16-2]|uniref:branched-chain amino acid ABC transporter permease n=1 Tax=Alloalcanivorax sp. C16-2 TaxID=3390052 RepID=UPI0039705623
MSAFPSLRTCGYAMLLFALVVAPWAGLYPVLGTKLLCYALFACAFHLLLGYTGLASLGHAAFLGVGGYVAGYGVKMWQLSPELALLAGLGSGALLGMVMGFISIRRSGIYFTMITLALAQMVYFLCVQLPQTGGEDGLQGIDRGRLFGLLDLHDDLTMYYTVLVISVAAFLFIARVVYSPFGQALQAIKDNEPRAVSLGYHPNHYKLIVFTLSAALTGLAGALKAISLGFVTLSDVHWMTSGHALLMTLVGGLGTLSGPVVGALALVTLENKMGALGAGLASLTGFAWFSTLGESVMMIMGIVFVLCVLTFRRGIMGELLSLSRHRPRKTA